MLIHVNQMPEDCASGSSLLDLLRSKSLDQNPLIATAVNGSFVRRDQRGNAVLAEGDRVAIFSPITGG